MKNGQETEIKTVKRVDAEEMPELFSRLCALGCVEHAHILKTADGFWAVFRPLSAILREKAILDVPDFEGNRLVCDRFFDDWFLYAVPHEQAYVYGLFKLREQEHDREGDLPADGDTPGVTISFISFCGERLLDCLAEPTDDNRSRLNYEINRVVAYGRQRHHKAMKRYFKNPRAQGAYLVATLYVRQIAALGEQGRVEVPEYYKSLYQKSRANGNSARLNRLPLFVERVNRQAGYTVCDNAFIYTTPSPDAWASAAILATHTGNTSVFSFAAEVEYHARFLHPFAKIKIPFFGKSIYASAIRADMTIDNTEFEGVASFYRENSRIVKRQKQHHRDYVLKG